LLSCLFAASAQGGSLVGSSWKVTAGDTLYGIGRAIYPGDTVKQAKLRRDIARLNPAVFGDGANNMKIGLMLVLPQYVTGQGSESPASKTEISTTTTSTVEKTSGMVASTNPARPEWVIKKGDTLYAIARSVFPGDPRKQASLRIDIARLNPRVFAGGASNMEVGVVLKLPAYVNTSNLTSRKTETVEKATLESGSTKAVVSTRQSSSDVNQGSSTNTQPKQVGSAKVEKPVAASPEKPKPLKTSKANKAVVSPVLTPSGRQPQPQDRLQSPGNPYISLGFSYFGDRVVEVEDWPHITAGSGGHLRIGYEKLINHGNGYRLGLGLQYNFTNGGGKEASLRDQYLQLAYQYQSNAYLYGIGIVTHAGATVENDDITTEFDSAVGAQVYAEYLGRGKYYNWGISYTALDFDEQDSNESIDASRLEIYYSWRL